MLRAEDHRFAAGDDVADRLAGAALATEKDVGSQLSTPVVERPGAALAPALLASRAFFAAGRPGVLVADMLMSDSSIVGFASAARRGR
jgi:hypothetical protein